MTIEMEKVYANIKFFTEVTDGMKIELFTHIDLDGVGCEIVFKEILPDAVRHCRYCDYTDIDDKIGDLLTQDDCHDCWIVITDIACSEDMLKKLRFMGIRVLIIDHHPTSRYLEKYSEYIFVEDGCGTSGLYEYLIGYTLSKLITPESRFVEYIADKAILNIKERRELLSLPDLCKFVTLVSQYDTGAWIDSSKTSKWFTKSECSDYYECVMLNALFSFYGAKKFRDHIIEKYNGALEIIGELLYDDEPNVVKTNAIIPHARQYEFISMSDVDLAKAILAKQHTYALERIDSAGFMFKAETYKIFIVFAEECTNIIAEEVFKQYPDVDICIVYDVGLCEMSLRTTRDDIDLGKDIAPKFGGGGHAKAAGAHCLETKRTAIIDEITAALSKDE